MTSIIPFSFDQHAVRTIEQDGQVWFALNDVTDALEFTRGRNAARMLDDDEKGARIVSTPGGDQEITIINESGLYSLILKSRKPSAKRFKKWVTAEVLPAIRKTGSYTASNQEPVTPSLSGRRWLIYFDHDGKECVTQVASDAVVMSVREMLKQFTAPNGLMISTEDLFDFVEAATANLKQRSTYQAQRLQQARQISL